MTAVARKLRGNQTDAEQKLWYYIRSRHLHGHKFRRQVPIGRFVVDFVCVEEKLIIEIDGGQHAEQSGADRRRSEFLNARGFRVLRFWNDEVLVETENVLNVITAELRTSAERPSP